MHENAVDLRAQRVEVLEILHADGASAHLVLVGRADAPPGRADLALARRSFAHDVEFAVQRQDQGRVLGDAQVLRADRHALLPQPLDLVGQRPRIDHHAVADHAELAFTHHARRQQRKLVGLVADDQRVAGVVAALEAHHDVGPLRQPVDDLAFALVAPLGADYDDVCHACLENPPVLYRRGIALLRRAEQRKRRVSAASCAGLSAAASWQTRAATSKQAAAWPIARRLPFLD